MSTCFIEFISFLKTETYFHFLFVLPFRMIKSQQNIHLFQKVRFEFQNIINSDLSDKSPLITIQSSSLYTLAVIYFLTFHSKNKLFRRFCSSISRKSLKKEEIICSPRVLYEIPKSRQYFICIQNRNFHKYDTKQTFTQNILNLFSYVIKKAFVMNVT